MWKSKPPSWKESNSGSPEHPGLAKFHGEYIPKEKEFEYGLGLQTMSSFC
jgi:hypothetical protein